MGANPEAVLKDMWEDYVQTPTRDMPADTGKDVKYEWCTPKLHETLSRTLNLRYRYSLYKAQVIGELSIVAKQMATEFQIMPLFEIGYHIIGQQPRSPSGHGQTELASRMGDVLSLNLLRVDCTEMSSETDMFGPKAPWQGSKFGSPLNNYLAKHTGQRCVIFLDEFDKTTHSIRQAMLLLFESGLYRDRHNHNHLDCSEVIWGLVTDFGVNIINKFWVEHLKDRDEQQQKKAPYEELRRSPGQHLSNLTDAPLTRRFTEIVPFLPFNNGEQVVVAYKFLLELWKNFHKPIDTKAKDFPGHLFPDFVDDGQIAQHLAAKGYVRELGASSLRGIVDREIRGKLMKEFKQGKELVKDKLNDEPLPKIDVCVARVLDVISDIVVNRIGVKAVQYRPKAAAEEAIDSQNSSRHPKFP